MQENQEITDNNNEDRFGLTRVINIVKDENTRYHNIPENLTKEEIIKLILDTADNIKHGDVKDE